jgi:uncharacterized phage protein (TIGR02218 family)
VSFLSVEGSQESGRPVEIYDFALALTTYRFTSAEDDQVVGGNTYSAVPISRGSIKQSYEARNGGLEITMPSDLELPSRYVTFAPSERARMTLRAFHRGDGELVTLFDGFVKSVLFDGEDTRRAKFLVESVLAALNRNIPRFTYRGQCNNVLYDAAQGGLCDVNAEDPAFKFQGTVSAQTTSTLTVPGAAAFGSGWFTGGRVDALDGLDARLIIAHVGDVLTLHVPFIEPMIGEVVILRAGCDRSIQTCSSKFNNVEAFQGFAFVPIRNPFVHGLTAGTC